MLRALTLFCLLACSAVSSVSFAGLDIELKSGQSGVFCKYDLGDGTSGIGQLNKALATGKISMMLMIPGDYSSISATAPFSVSAPAITQNGSVCVTITKN